MLARWPLVAKLSAGLPEQYRHWFHHFYAFVLFTFQRFFVNRAQWTAAALSYTTLLSLVPLMAVGFAFLSPFPVFQRLSDQIQDFIFQNFVPATGQVVKEHLMSFTKQTSRLTAVGIVVLVVTSLLMLSTIEKAFNEIWEVRERRKPLSAFMVYWAVLTLGPLLVGASLAVTSYLVSLPGFSNAAETLEVRQTLLSMMPFILTSIAFTLLYVAIPYRSVPVHHALLGGMVAALLFEVAKRGFALYVTRFPTYETIYGALATIPIFLVWIYVSWTVILLGAEITHCLSSYQDRVSRLQSKGVGGMFFASYRILGHLWDAQKGGNSLSVPALLGRESNLDEQTLNTLVGCLVDNKLVYLTSAGEYALAQDLSDVSLLKLYRIQPEALPDLSNKQGRLDDWDEALSDALSDVHQSLESSLNISLKTLYQRAES
jgi:membrane protein